MAPQDRKRFGLCLLAASELYGKPLSEPVIGLWWDAMKAWDIEAVEHAFRQHISNPDSGQFMPKPADVLRTLLGTSKDAALVAWAKIDRAVRTVGTYASVTFDDALIHRVLHDMGGWIGLGEKTDDEWPFVANEFRTRYQGYRQRGDIPDYPSRLIGIADAENSRKGVAATECVLIGNPVKAQAVADAGTTKPPIGVQRITSAKVLQLIDGARK